MKACDYTINIHFDITPKARPTIKNNNVDMILPTNIFFYITPKGTPSIKNNDVNIIWPTLFLLILPKKLFLLVYNRKE